jgi:hypothetical protein
MPHRLHESSLVSSTGEGAGAGALAHPTENKARTIRTVNPDRFPVPGTFIDNLAKNFKKTSFQRIYRDCAFSMT